MGRVLIVPDDDWGQLVGLLDGVKELPGAGNARWMIQQPRTSQPIDRVLIPSSAISLFKHSVSGYDSSHRHLTKPVEGFEELPDSLFELMDSALEAREGWREGEEDQKVIGKVKDVVDEANSL